MGARRVVVLGAGGLARETMWLLESVNAGRHVFRPLGYLDDDRTKHGRKLGGYPVLGGVDWIEHCGEGRLCAVLGVGEPRTKWEFVRRLDRLGVEFPTLIHPNVQLSRHVELGQGVVIGAGNILTVGIEIGSYTWLNLDCTVGHDARIGAYTQLNPSVNISGNVIAGEGVEFGTAAVTIPGVTIGDGAVIGAAACVVRDVPPNVTVVGVPAKFLKQLPPWKERELHVAPATPNEE